MMGCNISSVHGNPIGVTDTKHDLRTGYFPHPLFPGRMEAALRDIWALKVHSGISRIRTLVILAERDAVETPYLHVPITEAEAAGVAEYTHRCALPVELSITQLWEARYWEGWHPGPVPDNPFSTPAEVAGALLETIRRLIAAGIKPGTIVDIWNEFDLDDDQEPVMDALYRHAADLLSAAELPWTVSTVMDTSGAARPIAAYRYLRQLGGLPPLLEPHLNGWEPDMIGSGVALRTLRDTFWLPINVGECDADFTPWGLSDLTTGMEPGEELIWWR